MPFSLFTTFLLGIMLPIWVDVWQVLRLKDLKGFLLRLTLTKKLQSDAPSPSLQEPFRNVRFGQFLGLNSTPFAIL